MTILSTYKVILEEETEKVAHSLADTFQPGSVVALCGNLGAGKTFLVKKFCEKKGITNATSPSFALVNVYNNSIKINHFDFYRINSIGELYEIGFYDYISDPDAITFIEWADLFPSILPKKYYEIEFNINEDLSREITIKKYE
ncbi:MAG TPA: tRNA (adenosine(37)-N6)-threonylcarbamoyltransferase complex ATPase subunit type 1 TsaE [Ignavibacteriaceae bacterium]|jgi:tRNA threonylcarbamoyladenosine biosynthesis protein TsaE|nr:tRNA (adenosine(37)-N6)-threonylcarbamoyltransferase complex ATPase subunit type 1 TsaE [Ignavibacteriaceae bacterium]